MANGYFGKCKECTKEDVRLNYQKRWNRKQEYERLRSTEAERKRLRVEYQRNMRARNPEKYKARTAIGNAVRDGRIIRLPCEMCGSKKSHGHHDAYSKPLDVRWLCHKCHRGKIHGQRVA